MKSSRTRTGMHIRPIASEFVAVKQDFTITNSYGMNSESQRERARNGKHKAEHTKWKEMHFGKFEPKKCWKRCFSGREEYA